MELQNKVSKDKYIAGMEIQEKALKFIGENKYEQSHKNKSHAIKFNACLLQISIFLNNYA